MMNMSVVTIYICVVTAQAAVQECQYVSSDYIHVYCDCTDSSSGMSICQ